MYSYSHWYTYIQKLQTTIDEQQKKIDALQKDMDTILQEIQNLKETKKATIDKIEYKFDQLKIETLEGTLNIGLTPHASSQAIEEFAVNQTNAIPHVLHHYPELYPILQDEIYDYLDNNSQHQFQQMEQRYQTSLEGQTRHLIIDDIKKQIGERIYYYLNQWNTVDLSSYPSEQIKEETLKRLIHDVNQAIESFMKNIPKGGKDIG